MGTRRSAPVSTSRPETERAPRAPAAAAAKAAEWPFSRRKGTRCTATTMTAVAWLANATAYQRNAVCRAAHRIVSARRGRGEPSRVGDAGAGPPSGCRPRSAGSLRSTSQCGSTVVAASTAARTTRPCAPAEPLDQRIGHRQRDGGGEPGDHRDGQQRAGPLGVEPAHHHGEGRLVEHRGTGQADAGEDEVELRRGAAPGTRPARAAAQTAEPAVISPRAPWRSSQRPTGTPATPVSRTATENAPPRTAGEKPSSAPIGTWNTAKA